MDTHLKLSEAQVSHLGWAFCLAVASLFGGWLATLPIWQSDISFQHRFLVSILIRPPALALWCFTGVTALFLFVQGLASAWHGRQVTLMVLNLAGLSLLLVPASTWI